MTEAGVAALQTRRAFQQMVLAMEDEESGDEYDSDSDMLRSSESSPGNTGVVRLGADEYRKFQFRLRQLEELTSEQARKQMDMEQTIEQEVQERTSKVIEAMQKQISMYKQAKELECEREVQRRLSEQNESVRSSRASRASVPRGSSVYGLHTSSSAGSFRDSYNIGGGIVEEGKPLDKLLHPRRSRKRLEQMKEREEAQKREMEQFREFIRTTEMRATQAKGVDSVLSAVQLEKAKNHLDELDDPLLPESLLQSSPSDLIELICVLRKNGRDQEQQLEDAKRLVTAAIEAREEAETTAHEAVELTVMLDARLNRAVREEQKLVLQARKMSAAEEFRHQSVIKSTGRALSNLPGNGDLYIMSATDSILVVVAHEHSKAFVDGTIKSQWDYFEYSVKLALARWTALRMAVEGEWGGGDMRGKYHILLDEILNVFKYNKMVHADAMADNIGGYVEAEFGLICEDGSVEELAELLTVLAEECKNAQYDRVRAMHEQVQSLFPIDLKAAKIKTQDDGIGLAEGSATQLDSISEEQTRIQEPDVPLIDEDGFTTIRRSGRRKAPTKFYDPSAEFPGAA
ncbi:hypothetical protein BBO99_00001140 [Phytophthora kernoviae]|uniref:Uncharacterized protein n=2 Tax=Phytophthora kernoviae TaxID=325452 RepID=A0A421H0A1_9STRA|nr:hypothetical protein G195_005103 [Phytophthora kernoviae 00238/432]KAG2529648.1 hypothetical protein JM18_001371 [Phytophthora kernoviae]KAG2531140.1 hypothetical protein JM16_001235 [Phytophthora kernoviae]RLN21212.1 hypothetical protein BBI17_004170 [Phytophthora kernoviae]RLN84660.1 hypothetical protein BBO99_00001140 [Phytophthora kernoviae]